MLRSTSSILHTIFTRNIGVSKELRRCKVKVPYTFFGMGGFSLLVERHYPHSSRRRGFLDPQGWTLNTTEGVLYATTSKIKTV